MMIKIEPEPGLGITYFRTVCFNQPQHLKDTKSIKLVNMFSIILYIIFVYLLLQVSKRRIRNGTLLLLKIHQKKRNFACFTNRAK